MAGEIDERHVGADRLVAEGAERGAHAVDVEVGRERHVEADALRARGEVGRVVHRVGERGDVGVGRVADDEGDALLLPGGQRGTGSEADQGKNQSQHEVEDT